jgi:transposase, IS6 family
MYQLSRPVQPVMAPQTLFKWRHFLPDVILLNVRWDCRYSLSYRDLEEMMLERGVQVHHTTLYRWVQAYAPEHDKRCRPHLNPTNDSWKVDETYIKIQGIWKYLYRATDSQGHTLDFMLSAKRDAIAAKRFFLIVLHGIHSQAPRVINVDKNAAYPLAINNLKESELLPGTTELRQVKYLNNLIEQDHRFIKRIVNPGLGFGSFNTARRTIQSYEPMHMIRKGQVRNVEKKDILGQISFIHKIFGVAS